MSRTLNVLVVEDNRADFLLIERRIKQGGLLAECTRAESLEELQGALDRDDWDVVLSDYSIPPLAFTDVYNRIRERLPDVPIILVSGSIGEEKAVELLKQGICDFVLKNGLARLVPSIERSLEEMAEHRARFAAEEAMRASEERLNLALSASRMGVWEWDIQTKAVFWSPQCLEIFGGGNFNGSMESFTKRIHPEDVDRFTEATRRAQVEGTVYSEEFRIKRHDGQVRWISNLGRIKSDASGKPVRLIGTLQDITERKRREEEAQQSEERFRLIAETIDEVFWMVDHRATRILYVSPGYERVWQRSRTDLYADPPSFFNAVHTDDCEHVRKGFAAMDSGQPFQLEYRIVQPDGSICWIRDRGYPVNGAATPAKQYVGVAEDITERKKVRDALRQSEQMMRRIIESSPIGMRVSQNGRHVFANRAVLQMFGYRTNAEMEGVPIDGFYAPQDRERVLQALADLQAGRCLSPVYEVTGLTKKGKHFDVTVRMTRIDYQGKPASLAFITDVSSERSLRTRLFQAQKLEAVGTLAGGIAHDFNNILGIIIGNAEMVLLDTPGNSPTYTNIQRITEAALRAKNLVQQILTFGRQSTHERIPMSLAPLIREVLKLLRSTLPSTIEIHHKIKVPPAQDSVLADPSQIQQILMNLCTNAAHAMRKTGDVLEITYSSVDFQSGDAARPAELAPGSYVQLTVKDTGHGMKQSVLGRIFEPYFTTKELEGGTGLGLAVVHGIVNEHSGIITVASTPGKGSCFRIYFPRLRETSTRPNAELVESLPKGTESILLVDDERVLLEPLHRLLERLGYTVVTKISGVEALETVQTRSEAFDLVFTDQTMPKMTGLELAKQLMVIRPTLPVILSTGFSDSLAPEKSKPANIRAVVMKPFFIGQIARTIRTVLSGEEQA